MTAAEQLRRALDRLAEGEPLTAAEARELLAPLYALLGTVTAKAVQPPTPALPVALRAETPREERVLTVAETAQRFGRSVWWVYRRRKGRNKLPGFTPLVGGGYGFREKSIDRHIARRSTNNDA